MTKTKVLFMLLFVLPFSCNISTTEKNKNGNKHSKKTFLPENNQSARLFSVNTNGKFIQIKTYNSDSTVVSECFVAKQGTKIPPPLQDKLVIISPIKRIITLSDTHIGFLSALGQADKIVGVSGKKYIYNKQVRDNFQAGKTQDVGFEQGANLEKIISLHPDLVTVYNIKGEMLNVIQQLKNAKIPVLLVNEYLETTPLGQAEWIKAFAPLFEKENLADSLFIAVSQKYKTNKKLASKAKNKPTVLVNMPWKGTWYMAGGQSNVSKLISDAGGNYLWKNTDATNSIPLAFEAVYLKGHQAIFWLNPGAAHSLSEMKENDKRLAMFLPFQEKNVFARNARSNGFANDFLETGIVRPDLVLQDLIAILHPEICKNHTLYFYKKLK